ncbi:MAG: YegS/Rv2252/BmrU family lipid kinase [Pleurocapsa sp.]
MSRSACLIFNPVAGQTDSKSDLEKIKMLLSSEIDLDVRLTTPEINGDRLAREAIQRQVESIIVSGGDGTISAVADAVVGTAIPLGIISRGTANALANALGISENLAVACQTILDGHTRTIDTAKCNGSPMVLLVGIGFEAEAMENVDRQAKDRFGMLAYVLAGLQQLTNWEEFDAEIETDKGVFNISAAAITIANAAPKTSILAHGTAKIVADDGLLDITIVAPKNNLGSLVAAYDLCQFALNNEPAQHDNISYLQSKRVRVSTNPSQKIVADGEIIGTTPIEVECVPQSLIVYVPKKEEE